MARYRKIDVRLWSDEKVRRLSAPQPNAQTLWIYLLTGPHTTSLPGLFHIGEAALAEALGWPLEGFREAFREAFQEGLVKADWKARVVFIPNAVRYNPPESPNVAKSWRQHLDEIPGCALKDEAAQHIKSLLEGFGEAFAKAFAKPLAKALAKTMPNQEQEQEQEQEQDIHTGAENFFSEFESPPKTAAAPPPEQKIFTARPDADLEHEFKKLVHGQACVWMRETLQLDNRVISIFCRNFSKQWSPFTMACILFAVESKTRDPATFATSIKKRSKISATDAFAFCEKRMAALLAGWHSQARIDAGIEVPT